MEHTINACGHANSTVHENMQSLIEQSGSVRKYAKDEIIYLCLLDTSPSPRD